MSLDTEIRAGAGAAVHVIDETERAAVESLAVHLAGVRPRLVDDPSWVAAAREYSCDLPLRVRQILRGFACDSGPEAMLLLRNLPVRPDLLPATPNVPGSVQREAAVPAAVAALIGFGLGELVSFREEKSGALVQDVVPVPGMETFQGNAGSVRLNMHVENAFHRFRPDYVALLCLRNDHDRVAALQISSIRTALPLLTRSVREVLHELRYITEAPASFGGVPGSTERHGVLQGAWEDPHIKVDFESTVPLDREAEYALNKLSDALAAVRRDVILEPGDLAVADNRLALHGRNAFTPRYDGEDRWLQRIFVHQNLRQSREMRPGNGQVITSGVG